MMHSGVNSWCSCELGFAALQTTAANKHRNRTGRTDRRSVGDRMEIPFRDGGNKSGEIQFVSSRPFYAATKRLATAGAFHSKAATRLFHASSHRQKQYRPKSGLEKSAAGCIHRLSTLRQTRSTGWNGIAIRRTEFYSVHREPRDGLKSVLREFPPIRLVSSPSTASDASYVLWSNPPKV
jgi:hypothetical protein